MTEKSPDPRTAIMVCGHGSRDDDAIVEFDSLAVRLRERLPDYDVESGYLEFARPNLREGFEALKARGAKRIIALPGILFAAGHVKNDLPWEVNSFAEANPGITMLYGCDMGIDPRLLKASAERIEAAEAASAKAVERKDTLLLVIGRGTLDPDANSNIAKVARMLWEGMGFGTVDYAFSGVTYPLADGVMERAARAGYKRIIVFPYFLFSGVLIKRIYGWVDAMRARFPDVEFLKAEYLRDHPLVIDALVGQVDDILNGKAVMNCQSCIYREQVIGYETAVGAVQTGHHHDHVAGDHHHDHHHDHHGHGHHHGHEHGRHEHAHPHHGHAEEPAHPREHGGGRGGGHGCCRHEHKPHSHHD